MSTDDFDISFTIIETKAQDLQSICRTCLCKNVNLLPIDSEVLDVSLNISSLLESCIALKVDKTDNLPKQVCCECLGELFKIHCFKNKCHQNETILKLFIKREAETKSVKSEAERFASDTDTDHEVEEQNGLEGGLDDSTLNIVKIETDLENKVINVDDAGCVTVLNASVQIIHPDPTPENSDNQLSSDIQLEHQNSRQLNGSDESHINIKQEIEGFKELFRCKICQENFTSKKLLMDHARRFKHSQATKNTPKGQKKDHSRIRIRKYTNETFKCNECDAVFNNRYTWKRHTLEHRNFLNEESGVNFQCKICNENFTTRELLTQHANALKHSQRKDHQLKMCEICAKRISNRRFSEHMRVHTKERKYICEKCGESFANRSNLRRHILRHTGVKSYICDECGKGFTTAFCMKHHKKAHKMNKNGSVPYTYTCEICFCKLKSLHSYQSHINIKHKTTEIKSSDNNKEINKSNDYRCELCNKTFISKFTLKQHGMVHGDKTFECTTCGKAFFQRAGLNAHVRVHTGERPYKCHICSQAFTTRGTFVTHMRMHTGDKPFVCTVCRKKFRQGPHLKAHMKTHTGEKLHQCTSCGKSFTARISLTVHMRTHTGEQPYKCPKCEKGFYDSSSRRKHCMKSHGLELERIRIRMPPMDKLKTQVDEVPV